MSKKSIFKKVFFSLFSLTLIISLGFLFVSRTNSSTDTDGDGYASIATGGTDCVDQEEAAYKNNASCNEASSPVIVKKSQLNNLPVFDHTWIKDDEGVWHLFFSSGEPTQIQHATTTDFVNFKTPTVAVGTSASGFDSYGLWAPHVIKDNGVYFMYYTGVTGPATDAYHQERIGLAVSLDLNYWEKVTDLNNCVDLGGEGCVLSCGASWTKWGQHGSRTDECRDPMVIRDDVNNFWVMFMTTKKSSNNYEVISTATSSDLINWHMAGYIDATTRLSNGQLGQTQGGLAENSFVTKHNDTYYLWFTDWQDTEDPISTNNPRTMQQYVTASSLATDANGSANWDYQGYTPLPGVNATEVIKLRDDVWVMSQSIANTNVGSEYYDDGNNLHGLIWHRVVWNSDGTFSRSRLTNLSCAVASANINPGTGETCPDGIDNNCDMYIDNCPRPDPPQEYE